MPVRSPESFLAGLAACLLLAGCGPAQRAPEAEDRAAIDRIRAEIRDAELAGDAGVFERVAVEQVRVMPPGAPPIEGRAATVAAMRKFFEQFELRIDYADSRVELLGDTAVDSGTYAQTITPKSGGEPKPGKGSYLWIYRRAADGTWRQTHAIWN